MAQKIYRTAQGKPIDLGSLMLQNENTRAVGNMKVNARGDLLDGWNRPIESRTQQVKKQYDKQLTNVTDTPVVSNATAGPANSGVDTKSKNKLSKQEKPKSETKPQPQPQTQVPVAGLAAAIARAREQAQVDSNESTTHPRRI